LKAEGFPDDRLISVDLDNKITRVFNSDYFGESKKGGLRMWNKLVYDKGGLPLHAGCKVIPVGDDKRTALIIGLSGTGKTTTTFTQQNSSQPVQDDFVALMPDGSVLGTENGCFAKTFGLNADNEPMIHNAVVQPEAYLENVAVGDDGKVDFTDKSYTENGRPTFPFRLIPEAADPKTLPPVSFVLILNRNENIIPAVARLTKEQAAAYFMLGETKGTSAGGAEEAGKALRVPGTNPFFPLLHGQQGNRFLELADNLPFAVYLMNTGWVGGVDGTEFSKKVKIRHSSAVVQGIADEAISWKKCSTFGYEVATKLTGMNNGDHNLLNPQDYYVSTERSGEYDTIATGLREDRKSHLAKFPGLNPILIEAIS
jgi:phosphoenolpyruvate carboxykinase (ATP)